MATIKATQRYGSITVQAEGEGVKDVFKQLSMLSEIFDQKCGVCGCEDVRFKVRVVEDNEYFECVCSNSKCRAKLAYGQHKKGGTLYSKVAEGKGDQRKYLPNGGWSTKFSRLGPPPSQDEE